MEWFDRVLCIALLLLGALILHFQLETQIRLERIELRYERTFGPPIYPIEPPRPYPPPQTKII